MISMTCYKPTGLSEMSLCFCLVISSWVLELDALVVKRNAIIVIDFKNYGGEGQVSENNRWTCDGVPVKGAAASIPINNYMHNKFALSNTLPVTE